MEKYGVEIDQEKAKTASTENRCPQCGKVLVTRGKDGDVSPTWYCPNCGTKPWEKRPSDQEK